MVFRLYFYILNSVFIFITFSRTEIFHLRSLYIFYAHRFGTQPYVRVFIDNDVHTADGESVNMQKESDKTAPMEFGCTKY